MRSTHNVGSLFRTAEGLGIDKLFLTGYTPYPKTIADTRLPHIANKLDSQIQKTSLNAQHSLDWQYQESVKDVIASLRKAGVKIVALEQTDTAVALHRYQTQGDIAIILGTEVTGLPKEILQLTDEQIIIPMFGKKESFNVVQAAAMAMYQLRFY